MPEGDTIWRAARTLQRALAGKTVTKFETAFPRLGRVDQDFPVAGRVVESVKASGKWLEMRFSGDLILLTHMLMNGSWHIYRPGETWGRSRYQMRVLVATSEILAVAFNIQIAEFHSEHSLVRRSGYRELGPALLNSTFDPAAALANLQMHPEMEIGSALVRQSLLAGLGNVFKSEVCFVCGINPFRKIGFLSARELQKLVFEAERLIKVNALEDSGDSIVTYTGFRRTTGRSDPSARLFVYGRARERCRICGTPIRSRKQGPEVRVTYWCPRCQPDSSAVPAGV
jgi:endonuclease VIII